MPRLGSRAQIPSPAPNFSCVGPGHRSGWFCERVRSAAASTTLVDQALVSSRGCLCLRTCIRLHRALTANEDSPDLISPPAARAPISGRARCDLRHALAGAGSSRLKRHRPHGLADRPDKAEHLSGLWRHRPSGGLFRHAWFYFSCAKVSEISWKRAAYIDLSSDIAALLTTLSHDRPLVLPPSRPADPRGLLCPAGAPRGR